MKNKLLAISFIIILIAIVTVIISAYPEYKNIKESNKAVEKCVSENGYIGILPYPNVPFYLKIFGIKYKYQRCCPGLKAVSEPMLADVLKCKREKDVAISEKEKLKLPQIITVQLNEGESNGVYSRKNNSVYCKDSLMNEVNIDSFVVFKNSNYAKDNKNVYFPIDIICANCPGCGCFCEKYIITNANPETFEALNSNYAKDNKHAYFDGLILDNVDLDSFTVINTTSKYLFAAKDKNNVFVGNYKINADPDTFEYLDERDEEVWMKDKNKVWTMLGSDPSTLQEVEKADPDTFRLISAPNCPKGNENYALDKNYVYFLNKIVKGADPKTFKPLNTVISKDKDNAFAEENKIMGVDIKTFEVTNSLYSKDKNHVYFLNKIVKGADPKTFKP